MAHPAPRTILLRIVSAARFAGDVRRNSCAVAVNGEGGALGIPRALVVRMPLARLSSDPWEFPGTVCPGRGRGVLSECRQHSTQEFLAELSTDMQIPTSAPFNVRTRVDTRRLVSRKSVVWDGSVSVGRARHAATGRRPAPLRDSLHNESLCTRALLRRCARSLAQCD